MQPPLRLRQLPGHRRRKFQRRIARFCRSCHWIAVENTQLSNDGAMIVDIRIRRWHPGFWLAYCRAIIMALAGIRIKLYVSWGWGNG